MSESPERLTEFRDEVSNFFATDYPKSVRKKIARGQRLEKSDQILSQQALNAKGWLGVGWPKEAVVGHLINAATDARADGLGFEHHGGAKGALATWYSRIARFLGAGLFGTGIGV